MTPKMRKAKIYLQMADGGSPGTGWRYDMHVVNVTNKRPARDKMKPGAILIPLEIEVPAEMFGYVQQPLQVRVADIEQPTARQAEPAIAVLAQEA